MTAALATVGPSNAPTVAARTADYLLACSSCDHEVVRTVHQYGVLLLATDEQSRR